MNKKMLSLVTATLVMAGTMAFIATLSATAPAYAQGSEWCYVQFHFKQCFDNRGECNKSQTANPFAESGCFREKS